MAEGTWTEAEKAYARMLRAKRWRRKRIADTLGKSDLAVKGFFNREDISRGMRAPVKHAENVPLSVFDAREKRANEPRTLTAILCGDPPFSQSALGGRNANKGLEEISALYKAQARLD